MSARKSFTTLLDRPHLHQEPSPPPEALSVIPPSTTASEVIRKLLLLTASVHQTLSKHLLLAAGGKAKVTLVVANILHRSCGSKVKGQTLEASTISVSALATALSTILLPVGETPYPEGVSKRPVGRTGSRSDRPLRSRVVRVRYLPR